MPANSKTSLILWLVAYVAMLAAVVAAMLYARNSVLSSLDSDEARAQWKEWRDEATKQAEGTGPVKRKVPRTAEPPALVLMRDHFASCLVTTCLICTAMFGAFAFFLRGAIASSPSGTRFGEPPPDSGG